MSSLDHLLCAPVDYNKTNPRRCSIENCHKTAKRGGRCIAHGGGNKCTVEGCTTSVVSRGLCVAHGGGKRCQTPACTKSAQSGGFCWVHGGGKKCGYKGCPKRAQSGGACIAHGGGKRCRMDGCSKVVQYDGLCVGHGGYRRCVFEKCDQRAMPNDYCQQHGGSSVCVLENCYKRAVRGGMCSEHKTEASLQAITASGLTIPGRSSDEDRRRRAVRHKSGAAISTHQTVNPARTPEWQSRMNLCATTGSPSPESRVSATSIVSRFLRSEGSTRSPSPVRPPIRNLDELRQSDSPVAPGFSALLNADDRFPLFSADNKTLTHTQRYTRHPCVQLSQQQQQHEHQVHREHKVYPLLPGIHSLQNCRHETSSCGGRSSRTWSESSMLVLKASNSETVATHKVRSADFGEERVDPDEYAEEAPSEKQHVNSYYHRFTTESSWHVKHSTNGSSDSVHYC